LYAVIFLIVIITIAWNSFASDLKIDGIEWSRNGREHYKVKFTVSLKNSWRNDKHHDGAWIFLKYVSPNLVFLLHNLLHSRFPVQPRPN